MEEPKVSSMGFWMDNSFEKNKFTIVDCGYVNHPRSRNNAERLIKALGIKGRRNYVAVVGFGRVLVRVPVAKKPVLRRFRKIKRGGGYSWTTHCYDRKGSQFLLKYAV